ncbi:MAG TPA: YciI family protein [Candidatus Limnocylindria bacterium]|jgi:hypothetical protein|nr:YciI family protein [Candidatus Limnocylindria bacterium]
MRYAILIYDANTADSSLPPPDPETWAKVTEAYGAYSKMLTDSGALVAGDALQPNATATTIRSKDGQTVMTDGPFAETKEGLGGFYIVEARDLDHALELGKACPGLWYGSIEVRPVWDAAVPADPQTAGEAVTA